MSLENLQIMDMSFHRNGVAGMPFKVALVDDPSCDDVKLVIMFEAENHTAVLSLNSLVNEEDISSDTNAWKGDQYEAVLRPEMWETQAEEDED